LIVDEVLAVGDAVIQKKCLNKMNQVSRNEGRTVLFVSHNMTAIRTLCTKGILLKNGGLMGVDSMEKIIRTYEQDQLTSSDIRVADISQREGNGLLHFTDIALLDLKGNETTHLRVGEGIQIRVSFTAHESFYTSASSTIDIDINDHLNNRVAWLSTSIYANRINAGQHIITFQIDKVTLAQGEYNFNLYAANSLGISDWIKNVSRLSVSYDDYYGTGKKIPEKQLVMITDFSVR
ncbi:MAG: ABC transporter ATP-binding protein, partial [Cytophagales bacterium]|nr:ABC transporter ATP-binding protein [Cytophaga sp.]